MRTGEAFPSSYIKASDLKGNRVTVTIDHVNLEGVGKDKEQKPVVYFQGKDKGLVLNKTNANKITSLLGTDEMDDWQGGQVVLYGTMVEFGGEQVEGIRVAAVPPKARTAAPPKGSQREAVEALAPAIPAVREEFQASDDDLPF
jgi:hypothetical protein